MVSLASIYLIINYLLSSHGFPIFRGPFKTYQFKIIRYIRYLLFIGFVRLIICVYNVQ